MGEKVGVADLKLMIAKAARNLDQMGMDFNRNWRKARDELLAKEIPHISYKEFANVCDHHGLNEIATRYLLIRQLNSNS